MGTHNGEPVDLTSLARYQVLDSRVARSSAGRLDPVADGTTSVRILVGGRTLTVPVIVRNAQRPQPVSFPFQVLPVLTKQGCAGGSCHGSPHGKGGFSLSLYGYDPAIDRVSLTRDGYNRRINMLEPADSLIIKKPLLEVPHLGGKRLHHTDAAYRILRDWVYEGASTDLPALQCVGIDVAPGGSRVLHAPFLTQQIAVTARFSDGTVRDVTPIATFDSSNSSAISVDPNGLVTGRGRGQAAISVRYLDKLVSVYFTMVQDQPGFRWQPTPVNNFIDGLVNAKLKQLQYLPSPICTDAVFLRRVSLDLTGLLPSVETSRAFLADRSPDKRAVLIDRLLGTEEYARFWALKQGDLMRVSPGRLKEGRADRFASWLVASQRSNQPYDQFARELLTSSGDAAKVAPAGYFIAIPSMEERTEMTAQIFMGTRLECTKCHNHPFEKWTMRDYFSIAAVFARTQSNDKSVQLVSNGEAMHPTTHETMKPWGAVDSDKTADRREVFARWLTQPNNPYFARVEVNRIWADLLGRGIVDPVDDFRSSNPPSNVALLDALAADFEKSGYDRKRTIRLICNSAAYQRSSETTRWNRSEDRLFSHARVRLLTAEQMRDAMAVASGAAAPIPTDANRNDYATQRPYPTREQFTVTFGQPERATACTCERQNAPTLLQALEMLNGGYPHAMAEQAAERWGKMESADLIERVYLSALCRLPTERERATAAAYLAKAVDRRTAVTDLVWTVLNTREFMFQH